MIGPDKDDKKSYDDEELVDFCLDIAHETWEDDGKEGPEPTEESIKEDMKWDEEHGSEM